MTINEGESLLESACEQGILESLAEEYIFSCCISEKNGDEIDNEKKKSKNKTTKFPNLAGFCRYFGIGQKSFDSLSRKYPDEFEKLSAILEDEALNSEISPSLLGAYLKRRLGYSDSQDPPKSDVDVGQLRLVFEHDIIEDGE